jgi:xyloglucan-specific exo-beta-1,4-glucanase
MKNQPIKSRYALIVYLIICTLLLQAQNTEKYQWNSVKFGGGGFVTGIITCPTEKNLIYARTDVGGAYRWVEETQSWKSISYAIGPNQTGLLCVESLAIDPSEPNKVYLFAGQGYFNNGLSAILRSSDYGETFKLTDVSSKFKANGNNPGRANGERLAVDPNKGDILFCGTRDKGLFKSVDSGLTWTKLPGFPVTTTTNGNGICVVEFDASSSSKGNPTQTIYAAVSRSGADNIFISNDAGVTWNPIAGNPTTYMPHHCLLTKDFLYVTYADGEGPGTPKGEGAVWKYDLQNKIWKDISPAKQSFGGISVDQSNPQNIAVSTYGIWQSQTWIAGANPWGDDIYKSKDGGNTWGKRLLGNSLAKYNEPEVTWLKTSSQLHWAGDIEIDPFNADRIFVISGNGIYSSSNFSAQPSNWRMAVNGLEETVVYDVITIPGGPTLTVMGDYCGATYTDISKYGIQHKPSGGSSTALDYAGSDKCIVRSGSEITVNGIKGALLYSLDNGKTWKLIPSAKTGLTKPEQGYPAVNADGSIIAWSVGNAVYYTTDKGLTWNTFPGITAKYRVTADRVDKNVFYISTGPTFLTFVWNGIGFDLSNTLKISGVSSLSQWPRAVPGFEGDVWVSAGNSGLYRITNKGVTSAKISAIINCSAVEFGKAAPGNTYPSIYIWGKTISSAPFGIYRSDDAGQSWVRINDDQHQFGGMANGGFVKGDMNVYGRVFMSNAGLGLIYGDLDSETAIQNIPENSSESSGIYPNPFNHQFTINKINCNFTYRIFSITGTLMESGSGKSSVTAGQKLKNGLYFLEISSAESKQREVSRIVKQGNF